MTETHDVFLRAHTLVLDEESKKKEQKGTAKEKPWPRYILCFDCETLIDATLKLTFGAYRICKLVDEHYLCEEEGLFYDDALYAEKRRVCASHRVFDNGWWQIAFGDAGNRCKKGGRYLPVL